MSKAEASTHLERRSRSEWWSMSTPRYLDKLKQMLWMMLMTRTSSAAMEMANRAAIRIVTLHLNLHLQGMVRNCLHPTFVSASAIAFGLSCTSSETCMVATKGCSLPQLSRSARCTHSASAPGIGMTQVAPVRATPGDDTATRAVATRGTSAMSPTRC